MPRPARLRASVAVAAAAAACLLHVAIATAAGPTPEQALAELNAWRALAHESPVGALDPNRSEGCRLHNAYEALNGHVLTHEETLGNPGYSSLGATAGASSVLSAGEVGPREAWENAPYHRMSLLNPRMSVTGFDASSGSTCMNVFAEEALDGGPPTPELALYPWPADGTRGVPLAFAGGEVPSPYQAVPAGTKLGFALTVNVNGPWVQRAGTEADVGVADLRCGRRGARRAARQKQRQRCEPRRRLRAVPARSARAGHLVHGARRRHRLWRSRGWQPADRLPV